MLKLLEILNIFDYQYYDTKISFENDMIIFDVYNTVEDVEFDESDIELLAELGCEPLYELDIMKTRLYKLGYKDEKFSMKFIYHI
jgi:hypothetical protein